MSEDALIAALRQRDPHAMTHIFELYADKIYRLAAGMLHDEVQADGVVQDTFLALIEHIDRFEGRSSIGTWLYSVARNECLRRIRRARPQVSVDEMLDDEIMPENFTSWEGVPDEIFRGEEARRMMENAIRSLSPALQQVFTLRDVEGLSIAETARILQIGESAVKVRLHRARLILREKLAGYFEEYSRV